MDYAAGTCPATIISCYPTIRLPRSDATGDKRSAWRFSSSRTASGSSFIMSVTALQSVRMQSARRASAAVSSCLLSSVMHVARLSVRILVDRSTAQWRPLSRRSSPASYPAKPLASFRTQSIIVQVKPSSTDDPRRKGALPWTDLKLIPVMGQAPLETDTTAAVRNLVPTIPSARMARYPVRYPGTGSLCGGTPLVTAAWSPQGIGSRNEIYCDCRSAFARHCFRRV